MRAQRDLVTPTLSIGILMAAYLLLRPYGDHSVGVAQAESLASWRWVASHVCGMLALASLARLAIRLHQRTHSTTAAVARSLGLAGLVLVLPYFGAETFALNVIGRRSLGGDDVLALVPLVRGQIVAMSMFGLGLVLLAACSVLIAITWQRSRTVDSSSRVLAWAAWPLGVLLALLLPQFYLPAVGRMAYGVAVLLAAVAFAWAILRGRRDQNA